MGKKKKKRREGKETKQKKGFKKKWISYLLSLREHWR